MFIFTHFHVPLANGLLYLDPGSGSYLLQILLAAILGGAFALKLYWNKIRSLFGGQAKKDAPEAEVKEPPENGKES